MNKFIPTLLFVTTTLVMSCSDKAKIPTMGRGSACSMENPFTYGTGDHAGFDWAYKKEVRTCRGVPSAYELGCHAYLKLLKTCR